jgi:uncharacterized protein (DUF302 family)
MKTSSLKRSRHVASKTVTGISGNGVVTRRSPHEFAETVSRLERAASTNGAQLFSRIDHAANAKRVGRALEPTELLIFGRPEASTPLMHQRRTAGLDLPLKILVWRDGDDVWLAYNDIGYLALRHGATDAPDAVVAMYQWFDAVIETALAQGQ